MVGPMPIICRRRSSGCRSCLRPSWGGILKELFRREEYWPERKRRTPPDPFALERRNVFSCSDASWGGGGGAHACPKDAEKPESFSYCKRLPESESQLPRGLLTQVKSAKPGVGGFKSEKTRPIASELSRVHLQASGKALRPGKRPNLWGRKASPFWGSGKIDEASEKQDRLTWISDGELDSPFGEKASAARISRKKGGFLQETPQREGLVPHLKHNGYERENRKGKVTRREEGRAGLEEKMPPEISRSLREEPFRKERKTHLRKEPTTGLGLLRGLRSLPSYPSGGRRNLFPPNRRVSNLLVGRRGTETSLSEK